MPRTDVILDRWIDTASKIVRQSGSALDLALRMSYRHPNGFDKVSFDYTNLNEPTTRLHMWWPAGCDPLDRRRGAEDSDIHDHPWTFKSTVITGEIQNHTFSLRQSGKLDSSVGNFSRQIVYIRDRKKLADVVRVVRVADCDIDLRQIDTVRPGQSYSMDPATLHRLVPSLKTISGTLVLQQPSSRRHSTVIRPIGQSLDIAGQVTKFSACELRMIVGSFLDHIQ
jgi:hypothetical protein